MLNIFQNQLPIKVSDKYLIRYISNDDKKDLFQIYSNKKIAKYVVRKTHCSIKDTEEFIQLIKQRMKEGNNIYLGICEECSQKLIGIIRFLEKEDPSTLSIGYALNEDYWGRGIIYTVVNNLIEFIKLEGTYKRMRATVKPENINSQKCVEKLGFILQGKFNKSEIIDNKEIETVRLLYYKII
ncbi:GNAT family N-acetyltransferase [Clostridium estertheticum]|uniref:GNAT family N-acetyltransferase n=1 Tax=Clostridium estertheticum TaxID=238834 RepID=UPI0013E94BBE|nr:GNAT family N-acetyltransferase [Clostridium estertheticum]MBZ9687469.1 GNAT family N-acetyltransferase [Clostridium estertheticum]